MALATTNTNDPRNDEEQVLLDGLDQGTTPQRKREDDWDEDRRQAPETQEDVTKANLHQGDTAKGEAFSETAAGSSPFAALKSGNGDQGAFDLPGERFDYQIEQAADGSFTIEHLASGEQIQVSGVEYLRFSGLQIHNSFLTRTNPQDLSGQQDGNQFAAEPATNPLAPQEDQTEAAGAGTSGNEAPTANAGTLSASEDGGAVAGTLSATDTDGDSLTYSLVTGPAEGAITVNADGSYSFDPGTDFQDLGVGQSRDVSFTYEANDGQGGTSQNSVSVTVSGTNDGPVAASGTLNASEDGGTVDGNLSALDIDGDTLTYSLVSGPAEGSASVNADGSYSFDPGADFQDLGVGQSRDVSFTYEASDGQGGTSQNSVTVTVSGTNDGPTASAGTLGATEDGGAVTGSLSASDVDGDTLTYSLVTGTAEGVVTVNADGSYSFDPGGDFQDLGVGQSRDVTFTYQADDGQGGTAQNSVIITVSGTNDGPVAASDTLSASEDGGAVNGTLSASDIDGDTLTYSLVSGPAEGAVTVNADGSYSFDPSSDFQDLGVGQSRDATFTYQADDGQGGASQNSVTVTVSGTNDGPTASAGTLGATEDGGAVTGNLSASDVDGDTLTYSLVTGTAEGAVTVNADGSYSFDPGADLQDLGVGQSRDVNFTYEVNDGQGGSSQNSVTVTVSGTNDGPTASSGTLGATEDGGAVTGSLSASDVDGDTLTYSLVTGTAEGVVTVNADGSYSFDPGGDFQDLGVGQSRDVTFTYQADDGQGGTAQNSVIITVSGTNDGPVAASDTLSASEDGGAVNGTLSASDIDGDTLTYSLVSGPAEGAVTVNADGSYSFDPSSDFQDLGVGQSRDATFTYQADDGQGGASQNSVTVTVSGTNDGPTASAGTLGATEDGGAVTGNLSASDVDGDTLTYSLVTGTAEGAVTVNADGSYSFDPGADLQDLGVGQSRDVNFTYEVNDGQGGSSQNSVTVTVSGTNDGPTASSGTLGATEDGGAVAGTLSASDIDGDTLTYSLVTGPAEGAVTVNADGSYSFDPGGDFQDLGVGESRDVGFTYETNDGQGGASQNSVTVTVTGANDGPVAAPGTLGAAEDGGIVAGTLSASDMDGDSLTYSLVTGPTEGSATVNADGSYSFDPGADFQDLGVGESRDVDFTYEANDGQGGRSQNTVTVTVVGSNDGPVAQATAFSMSEDTSLLLTDAQLLAGASDTDGDTLSVDSVTVARSGGKFGGYDGSVTDNGNGTWLFEPDTDFNGTVNLDVTISDGHGGTDSTTAAINVVDADILGTAGADRIRGTNRADVIDAGAGNDIVNARRGDDTVVGGEGNDRISGQSGDDVIYGGGGMTINGGQGDDTVYGGGGNDRINGGRGDDTVYGGAGDDRISGSSGNDVLRGGQGDDNINGGGGNDQISGGEGDDRLNGGGGNDTILGGQGADTVNGGSGHDQIAGDEGDDRLNGGGGNDTIYGGQGIDTVYGGSGRDQISGDGGDDLLNGGGGNDTFVYDLSNGIGNDTLDGDGGRDSIDLTNAGGGWTVTFDNGDSFSDSDTANPGLFTDTEGTIDFANGDQVTFENIESFTW